MANEEGQRKAFEFLREHAMSQVAFTKEDLAQAAGWKDSGTYRSKHFRDYLEKTSRNEFRVRRAFRRVTWEEFREVVTQVRRALPFYERSTYRCVVTYDFLMPLTREDKLRKALNELFYRDTLERRFEEIGFDRLATILPRRSGEPNNEYVAKIIEFIEQHIGGYSVSHVQGRFRTGAILSREQAGKERGDYLIDETTAIARFIIPCLSSKVTHGGDFELGSDEPQLANEELIEREIQEIRGIFFEVFVEGLVPTIRGESLIWLLETTPAGQRLHQLSLLSGAGRSATREMSEDESEGDQGDDDLQA